jgi:NADPH:quinone reductase-like Zn-dependent oxidoreductase
LVRITATPINPSDLGLLLGPADPARLVASGTPQHPVLTGTIHPKLLPSLAARVGASMPVGNEGAGEVVAAGPSPRAQALLGKTVAVLGGAMYSQFIAVHADATLVLPAGTTAAEGASALVNPLTALGMVETMRREGHTALVHTAAASSLGQMLVRLCLEEKVSLVNVVRKPEQAALLRGLGATHVVDSSSPEFSAQLLEAIDATGATLGFDAIGGGPLAGQILAAMEKSLSRKATRYNRYGSATHKQVYIYGALDLGPTTLPRTLGMAWGVGGWLLMPFLARIGNEAAAALKARAAAGLKTIFATHYAKEISLAQVLDPEVARAYSQRATGAKYLINPSR